MKKSFILGIIVGGIIFGTSVYAVTNYLYKANEVSYTPGDSSWNVGNVKEAIDNLKSTSGTALTDLKNTNIAKAVNANGSSFSSVINVLSKITNQGGKSFTINQAGDVIIPAGYYDGTGKIHTNISTATTFTITINWHLTHTGNGTSYKTTVIKVEKKVSGTYNYEIVSGGNQKFNWGQQGSYTAYSNWVIDSITISS